MGLGQGFGLCVGEDAGHLECGRQCVCGWAEWKLGVMEGKNCWKHSSC